VTPRCQIVDAHFEALAQRHVEAKFAKIDAEKSPYLVEKLGIILMPTIILVKDGHTDHSIRGFDEFGGADDFTTADVAHVLCGHGMIKEEIDRSDEISQTASRAGLNHIGLKIRSGEYDRMSDSDDDFST
jgi:hypothetical protein